MDCSRGFQLWISSACCALRSEVQPFAICPLQKFAWMSSGTASSGVPLFTAKIVVAVKGCGSKDGRARTPSGAALLSDAERSEDLSQQVVAAELTGNPGERVLNLEQLLGDQLAGTTAQLL